MRLIQTLIPDGKRDTVVDILETEGIDFAMTKESSESGYSDILYIPAESDSVEGIVDQLRDVGVERDGYMVVTDVETIISEQFEEKQDEDDDNAEDERISRDELRTKARNLSRSTTNYLVLTIISAIVATAGLLQDSAAVVVGSMVIAPLIGPAMASCVGTVINDDDNALFWEGIRSQAVGLAVAVLSATLFALSYRALLAPELELLLIQQVAERAHPGLLALAIALGAGTAGALSLTSGADEALVGVMIAVALIAPSRLGRPRDRLRRPPACFRGWRVGARQSAFDQHRGHRDDLDQTLQADPLVRRPGGPAGDDRPIGRLRAGRPRPHFVSGGEFA